MIKEREEQLKPLYLQVAHTFADLHDRAGRMKAKGVIREIVPWQRSREYFYWRIRRYSAQHASLHLLIVCALVSGVC
jgi:acetyl-CoA carboxylase/biotin carboxylase 1